MCVCLFVVKSRVLVLCSAVARGHITQLLRAEYIFVHCSGATTELSAGVGIECVLCKCVCAVQGVQRFNIYGHSVLFPTYSK